MAVEVEESGFGADQVLEADFAEGDFGDGGFLEWGLREEMIDVAGDAIGDLLRGFWVVLQGDVVGAESVFQGVQRGLRFALRGLGSGAELGVAKIGFALFLSGHNGTPVRKISLVPALRPITEMSVAVAGTAHAALFLQL